MVSFLCREPGPAADSGPSRDRVMTQWRYHAEIAQKNRKKSGKHTNLASKRNRNVYMTLKIISPKRRCL